MKANFLTGPVALTPDVSAAFQITPLSHREPAFLEMMSRTRDSLKSLVNASHVAVLVGSGTLANDAVAAQLRCVAGPGLILANGEFGERLIDHASRWNLVFTAARHGWGQPIQWSRIRDVATRNRPAWIWAVLAETSTGVVNPLGELLALSEHTGAELCLDTVSAIGLMPVDLERVGFATAVSGKGLAAPPGLAAVFHRGRLGSSERIPRYLDLALYDASESVPFTHSSNLLAALDRSLIQTCWSRKFDRVQRMSAMLRLALRNQGLPPLAAEADAAPGIVTVALPGEVSAVDVAIALDGQGFQIGFQSQYLRQRNWLQICLMSEFDEAALRLLPGTLARHVAMIRASYN